MKNLLIIAILATALMASITACKTTDPVSGERRFDPVKTEQVKASIEPVISSVVRRVIDNSPENSDAIATYLRAVGGVFCSASASGALGPEEIINAADMATSGLQGGVEPEIIDAKNVLIALYKLNYGDRFRATLPADMWPKNVADVLCAAINQGLIDAGKAGVQ